MAEPAGTIKRVLAANAVLALMGITSYALTLFDFRGLWGIDYLTSLPLWARTALVAALAALAIPPIGMRAAAFSERLVRTFRGRYLLIALILVYIPAAYLLRSSNHALGDGHNLLANIADTTIIRPTEPLEYYLHIAIFKAFFAKIGAVRAYQVLSIIAGMGFLVIVRAFARKESVFAVALSATATFGTIQFFFGYVEHYTFAMVFGTLFVLSALRDLDRGRPSPWTFAALILAILSHLFSLVLLPAAAYLLLKTWGKKGALLSLSIIGLVIIAAFIFEKSLVQARIIEIFAPMISTENNPYTLFSISHLSDMANLLFLSFPLLLILPVLPFRSTRPQKALFAVALAATVVFTFMIDPSLGAARDWDLLSAPAIPLLAWTVFAIGKMENESRKLKYLIFIPTAVFALYHTGGWIAHNSSMKAGYERVKRAVASDIHYSVDYYRGSRNKSWSVIAEEQYADLNESIRASLVRYAVAPLDPANTVHLAEKLFIHGDTAKALELAVLHYSALVDSAPSVIPSLGSLMMQAKRLDLAERIYDDFIAKGNVEFTVLHNLAYCMDYRGRTDSAMALYQIAFDRFEGPAIYEIEYYLKCVQYRYYPNAIRGLKKMLPKMNPTSRSETEGLIRALEVGDITCADSLASTLITRLRR
jgi:tetratricopeptide (TPR) repeat protein